MSARISTPGDSLTPRETQVAIALLFGHSIATTAAELGMMPATVCCHRERLYHKFGARGLGEFAAILTGTAEQLPAWLMHEDEGTSAI